MVRAQPMRLGSVVVGECAERREAVQIADLRTAPPSPMLDVLLRAGVRAVLAVPLLHQDEVIGALVVRRNHPGAFSPEIIRLLEAFAAQSAIAVHNARVKEPQTIERLRVLGSAPLSSTPQGFKERVATRHHEVDQACDRCRHQAVEAGWERDAGKGAARLATQLPCYGEWPPWLCRVAAERASNPAARFLT